jgi:hypothetical protein
MPWMTPKSPTDNEVYAVTACILRLNGIIDDNDVIPEVARQWPAQSPCPARASW